MKNAYKLCKEIMCFTPGALLSNISRERCIANINELPTFIKGVKTKYSASVLVPICVVDGEVSLLYTLRSSHLKRNSGQVSFPGGKLDKNETVYEAALRETEEEIGVPPEDIEIWARMCDVQGSETDMMITPIVGEIKNFDMKMLKANEAEVAEIFTVPVKHFCNKSNHGCVFYNDLAIPVFSCGKHRVWGITGIITHFFLQSFLPGECYTVDFLRKEFKMHELVPPKL